MRARSQKLEQLRESFAIYSSFWEEWCIYKFNGLDEKDLYAINIFKAKDFKFNMEDMVMFYYNEKYINSITEKLKLNYGEFQDWLLIRFHIGLVKLGISYAGEFSTLQNITVHDNSSNLNCFFNTEIRLLEIEKQLKNALLNFGFKTLNEIFDHYSDQNLKEENVFQKIVLLQVAVKNYNLRREVKSLKVISYS